MKKTIIAIAGLIITVSASAGALNSPARVGPWYAGLFYSTNIASRYWSENLSYTSRFNNFAPGAGARLGYRFPKIFRLEAVAHYMRRLIASREHYSTSGESRIGDGMLNAYADFNNSTHFTPYIGAGFGYARIKYYNWAPAGGRGSFDPYYAPVAQVIAGVMYSLNQHFSINFNGTYWQEIKVHKLKQNGVFIDKVKNFVPTLNLGVVYFLDPLNFNKAKSKDSALDTTSTLVNPWYLGAFLSTNVASKIVLDSNSINRYKNLGLGWGGRLGYRLSKFFRLETASSYHRLFLDGKARFSSGRAGVTPIMLNAYVDFSNRSCFTPYIGGGFGYAKYRVSNMTDTVNPANAHESFDAFYAASAQAIAGIRYKLGQQFAVDFNATYFEQMHVRKIKQNGSGSTKAKITMPTLNLGIVYFFGFNKKEDIDA